MQVRSQMTGLSLFVEVETERRESRDRVIVMRRIV